MNIQDRFPSGLTGLISLQPIMYVYNNKRGKMRVKVSEADAA